MNDLKFAVRQFLKNPGFTVVAVLTLALGIGANTAIVSVINGVLLKPLPYEQPGQLVNIWESVPGHVGNPDAGGGFKDWKEHATTLEGISVLHGTDMNLTESGRPERVSGLQVSASFVEILRLRPVLGRGFSAEEDQLGHETKVVVLTHAFWNRR